MKGWLISRGEKERNNIRHHLKKECEIEEWDLITAAWKSKAILAIAPMQDILDLDTTARMNIPGIQKDNWEWRMQISDAELEEKKDKLLELNYQYGRN